MAESIEVAKRTGFRTEEEDEEGDCLARGSPRAARFGEES